MIDIVKSNCKSQMKGAYVAPLVLKGNSGVGKTSKVRAMAEEEGWGLINVSMAGLAVEALSGIPSDMKAPEMNKYSEMEFDDSMTTRWSVPELIEGANTLAVKNNGCILLLDDLHEAPQHIISYMYDLLLERKVGQYRLDSKVAIVATMNNSEETNYQGFSAAVVNRLMILEEEFNFDKWFKVFGPKMHLYVRSFLQNHRRYALEQEDTMNPFATPRSWTFLSNTIKDLDSDVFISNIKKVCSCYISKEASSELMKHIVYINDMNFEKILSDRKPIDLSAEKVLDQIRYAYIINYVKTIDDAKYAVDLINQNKSESNFLGFIAGELYSIFLEEGSISKGKEELIKLIKNESSVLAFTDRDLVMSKMAEYHL